MSQSRNATLQIDLPFEGEIFESSVDSFEGQNDHKLNIDYSRAKVEDRECCTNTENFLEEASKLDPDLALFVVDGTDYIFANNSLFFLTNESGVRYFFVRMAVNKIFNNLMLFCVLVNSIILALSDFSCVDSDGNLVEQGSWRNTLVANADYVFVVIFSIECIIKIIAYGFYAKSGAYMNDSWNWLDIVVVITGLIDFIPGFDSGVKSFFLKYSFR